MLRAQPCNLKQRPTRLGFSLQGTPFCALTEVDGSTTKTVKQERTSSMLSRSAPIPPHLALVSRPLCPAESSSLCIWRSSAGGFIGTPTARPSSASRVSTQSIWLGKHRAEVARDGFGDCVQIERLAEFLLHRRDRLRRDAAGDDQVEVAEVGVYVEGEAVRGDEAGDVDADGGEFGFGRGFVAAPADSRFLDSRERFCESFSSARNDKGVVDPSRHPSGLARVWSGWRSRRRCGSGLLPGGGRNRRRLGFVARADEASAAPRANPRRSKMG